MEGLGLMVRTLAETYAGRRVLVTGHTGFKGSWLCQWLLNMGASVSGYALQPPTSPALFNALINHPDVRSGKVRAYAVTASARSAAAPEIPTGAEAGFPMEVAIWHGLWAPKGTPAAIVAKLNAAVVDSLANPATKQRLTELGHEVAPRDKQTPEGLYATHKADVEKWGPIIKAANIKGD